MKPDKETVKVLTEGEMVSNFAKSDGWAWAKGKLLTLLADIQHISGLDTKQNPDSLIKEIHAKQLAIDTIMAWISEVEGRANQHRSQEESLEDEIVRTED